MTTIYFVRHATTDFAVKDDYSRPLTEDGVKAAEELVQKLDGVNVTSIYSSPYIRTLHTIQPFAKNSGISITEEQDLRERHVGTWVEDFKEYSQNQWSDFHYKLPSGESLYETQQRNIQVLSRVLESHKGEAVIISTHGTALCTILNYFDSSYDYHYFESIAKVMPYVLKIEFDGAEMKKVTVIE